MVVIMFFRDSITDTMQAQGWWRGSWMVAESEKRSSHPWRELDVSLLAGKEYREAQKRVELTLGLILEIGGDSPLALSVGIFFHYILL